MSIADQGHFALKGSDASFTLGYAFVGDDQDRVLVPNDKFPVDLLLFVNAGGKMHRFSGTKIHQ
jgi:hypothetical protein